MQPAIDSVAATYKADVDLVTIDISIDPDAARSLGVKGTPTLIGIQNGEEVFRHTGRLTRVDLEHLFSALARDESPRRINSDLVLRLGAGAVLMVLGVAAGPVCPLVGVGGVIFALGLLPLLKWRR
jgi:hypothetical protein